MLIADFRKIDKCKIEGVHSKFLTGQKRNAGCNSQGNTKENARTPERAVLAYWLMDDGGRSIYNRDRPKLRG